MPISSPIAEYMPVAMPPEPVCRLAVSQYHEMIAAGMLYPFNSDRVAYCGTPPTKPPLGFTAFRGVLNPG